MENHLDIPALDLKEVIKLNLNVVQFFGYLCPEYGNSIKKFLYYVYAVLFINFIFVAYIISEVVNMIIVFGDLEKMSEGSFLFLTHFIQSVKLSIFIRYNSRIWKLVKSINRKEFQPQNWKQYEMLMDIITTSKQITKLFIFMVFATCMLWGLFPLWDRGSETMKLPLSGWFPFNIDESPVFEMVYIYLVIGSLFNGWVNISMDTLVSGTIMVIFGQLKLLNYAMENIGQNYGNGMKLTKQAEMEMRKTLIENVIHHKNILEFADEVTFLFSTYIMNQVVVGVIVVCISMFQMSLVSVLSLQFFSMLLYQTCVLMEVYLWCYYGNEVMLQSEKLTKSAYTCRWIECTNAFKRDLLFFMTRTQFPLKLYAGGYFTLSLETFKAIVKSSWSYFAVLNRIHSTET